MGLVTRAARHKRAIAFAVAIIGACGAFVATRTLGSTGRPPPKPGALVRTSMQSQVGVVLDEIPTPMRSRVAASLIKKPASFWVERAHAQLKLTTYRLVFRRGFYNGRRRSLPLPPEPVWNVALNGKPRRLRVDGHDLVGVDYSFSSMILTDRGSPAISEPALAAPGGKWREPFMLPVDPELVMQRTGYACMNEQDFPFGSVDSEQVSFFYDQTVVVEKGLSNVGQSHYAVQPKQSCVAAVRDHIGRVKTSVLFERLRWDSGLANRYRYGAHSGTDPDLSVYLPDFRTSYTNYRYIHSNGCEVVEGSVGGTGWRRLMQFATTDENIGDNPLTIGSVDYTITGHARELDAHNLYEFSPCHHHFHFKYYGRLGWRDSSGRPSPSTLNAKKGFCLQATNRVANREASPLQTPFDGCDHQGVSAGWVDQYEPGIDGQWIDTTDLPAGVGSRTFESSPNGLLCEGKFVDASGKPLGRNEHVVWAPTGMTADNGKPVEAPLCKLKDGWKANNSDSIRDTILPHGQGLITSPCTRGQIGPLRNCGFGTHPGTASCMPGRRTTATFTLPPGSQPQVVRLTEFSHQLSSPIPARYEDSYVPLKPGVSDQSAMLATRIVPSAARTVLTFICPSPRTGGAHEPGGTYSIYTAPVYPDDRATRVLRVFP